VTELLIEVSLSAGETLTDVTARYKALSPKPACDYLDADTGDVTLPWGSAGMTLRFRLAQRTLQSSNQMYDVSFATSDKPTGDAALQIRRIKDGSKPSTAIFGQPALDPVKPTAAGPLQPYAEVAVTVGANDGETYSYCLSIGLRDDQQIIPCQLDPIIINGGSGRPNSNYPLMVLAAGIGAAVAATVFAVLTYVHFGRPGD
jgi:hypothetical protein